MTADQPPPAAVQIAARALGGTGASAFAGAVVAALARRYAFVDHAEYAALQAVADAGRELLDTPMPAAAWPALRIFAAALDPAPAGTTAEGGSPCDCPRTEVGTMAGNSGHCAIHPLPGCPNPACGETWIKAFHGDHCDSCGWTAAPAGTTAEHPCTCGIHGPPHQRGTGPCILPAGRGPGRGRPASAGRRPAALLSVACPPSRSESPIPPGLTAYVL
jgi:hypothetical protein